MPKYRNNRDRNEPELVETLTRVGCKVLRVNDDTQDGVPDLLVRFDSLTCDCKYCREGVLRWIEVKTLKGKLSAAQEKFHDEWGDTVQVARTIDDALRIVGR